MDSRKTRTRRFKRSFFGNPPTEYMSSTAVEEHCRCLFEATSEEQLRKWKRPLITPDEAFGPLTGTFTIDEVNFLDKPESKRYEPVYEVDEDGFSGCVDTTPSREHAVLASFLDRRWGYIMFDPWRSESDIFKEVKTVITRLRKSSRQHHALRRIGLKNLKDATDDQLATYEAMMDMERRKPTRPFAHYRGAYAYYMRLSGKSRREVADEAEGHPDAVRSVDSAVNAFIEYFYPKRYK